MALKIHKSKHKTIIINKAFTLPELVITIVIISIVAGVVTLVTRPAEHYSKGRDTKRLSDLMVLERIFLEINLDTDTFPGETNFVYSSNVLPQNVSGPVSSIKNGWLGNLPYLSKYNSKLPIDPINDSTYKYIYKHNGNSFEINAKLEHLTDKMQDDGGNDPNMYEIGNDLTLL